MTARRPVAHLLLAVAGGMSGGTPLVFSSDHDRSLGLPFPIIVR